ncbi:MAG TPA: hypothetical protein PK177_09000 [Burkholderiaceae bacterium]|nr:hypothetical protein [Burkholderiaceae bacterium]
MSKNTPTPDAAALRPICFAVMPFGVKETGATAPHPLRVDFDALWHEAIAPALESLGYRAVRADQDTGAVIVKDMLERLFYSDLVVADVSIANANAYYEVGVRHAAREKNCVLIAADWAKPVFDLAQIRRVPYPLAEERIGPAAATAIREQLAKQIPEALEGRSPMHTLIDGYPTVALDSRRAQQLADQLEEFEALRAQMLAIRNGPSGTRVQAAHEFLAGHPAERIRLDFAAAEIYRFVRDVIGDWALSLRFIDRLPEQVREQPWTREQRALAVSCLGSPVESIAALETLIRLFGDSPERSGLMGGRYKKLYNASVKEAAPDRRMLERSIESYERGMRLDLNEYYCSCNLPALYRERAGDGDEKQALATASVARLACERARERGTGVEWLKPTLLGLAFAERNLALARSLAREGEKEGADAWKLNSTLDDLRRHIGQMPASKRKPFEFVVEQLARL